ncbi:CidA/LrgA family protein [Paracoccus pacificus]|uniref:CidA/LrgA family protein n=1 Tax=Paracoccus pacificus TaxID=1463598 RepID=A0ABW4R1Q6_9RHOB
MIPAITIILCFQLGGEIASRALGLTLPGPVIGLVALVLACLAWPRLADMLRPATSVLLANLSLLFVPAGVGVVAHLDLIRSHGIGLAVAILGSTALAIAAGALVFVAVARLTGAEQDE